MSNNFIYKLSNDSDFLMHHGIKGQKWGIMNGPPYPLTLKDYSALEKRMNNLNQLKSNVDTRKSILRNTYESNVGRVGGANRIRSSLYNQTLADDKFIKSIRDTKKYIKKLKNLSIYKNKDSKVILKEYEDAINELVNNTPHLTQKLYVSGMGGYDPLNPIANISFNKSMNDSKFIKEFEDYLYENKGDKYRYTHNVY